MGTGVAPLSGGCGPCFQEFLNVDAGFTEDGAQCACGQVARMMGQGDLAARLLVTPDFVAAGRPGRSKAKPKMRSLRATSRSLKPA